MNRKTVKMIALMIGAAVSIGVSVRTGYAREMTAREIIRQIETQYQGQTSHAVTHMRVVTARWTREMTLETWSKGRDRFLARVLAPKKDEGVSTLKVGNDIWNYLPNIDRVIKIPSGMMGDSWMGSHLTNDDLVKGDQVDELYDLTMTQKEDVAEIAGVPKPGAAVVWGRIVYMVDLERMIPLSVRYYDEAGNSVRTITFEDVQRISGRWVPMRMRVQPEDAPRERTVMQYQRLRFDVRISDDLFTLPALRRR